MSDKKKLIDLEETRLTYMAGMLLKEVAAGLSKRELELKTEEGVDHRPAQGSRGRIQCGTEGKGRRIQDQARDRDILEILTVSSD